MRDIAVHCTTFHDWPPSVRYAVQLATEAQARLTGLYIGDRKTRAPGPPLLVEEMAAASEHLRQQSDSLVTAVAIFRLNDERQAVARGAMQPHLPHKGLSLTAA